MEKSENQYRYFIAMSIAMLLWGVAWTSGKVAVEHSTPQVAAFWRYTIALLGLIPVMFYMKIPLKSNFKGYIYITIGGLLTALFNYLFFRGLAHGQAGYGGTLVTALAPVLTYIMSVVIFKLQINARQVGAIFIGIVGGIILLRIPFEGFGFLNADSLYFLECAIVWSLVTIFSQKAARFANPMFYTLIAFAITCFINMIFALPYHPFEFSSYDTIFWENIIFIGLLPGTFSTALFFISAGKVGAHNAAVFMFIVPIGAIVSSMIVYQENIELSTIIGCLLAFIAVIVFNKKGTKV